METKIKSTKKTSAIVLYPTIGVPYRHYKGGIYEVVTMATHSETQEPMVVYKSLLFGSYHVRPLSMWGELIMVNGTKTQRFKRISQF